MKEWKWSTLGKVAEFSSGGTPSRANMKYWDGDIPWVTTSQINFGVIRHAGEMITEDGLQNSSAKLFPMGTILIALYGQGVTRGKVARLGIEAATNQACAAIFPGDDLSNDFLFYYLVSQYDNLRDLSHGGNQKNLSARLLKTFPVPIVPMKQQGEIVAYLQRWDKAISLTERLIAAKQELRKGLMQQLLTGKRRFPEFGQPRKKDDRVPDDWDFPRTEEVFESYSIKNHPDETVLSVTQDQGVVPRDQLDRRIQADTGNHAGYKLVEPGSFVISLRSFQGGLEYSNYRGLVSPAYHVIRPKTEICDDFYRYYFKSPEFIQRLAIAVIGIRDGKQVAYGDFSFMRIPVPSLEEQRKIASVLVSADKEIALLKQKLDALKEQKKGLMQQLLTGKVRVTIEEGT